MAIAQSPRIVVHFGYQLSNEESPAQGMIDRDVPPSAYDKPVGHGFDRCSMWNNEIYSRMVPEWIGGYPRPPESGRFVKDVRPFVALLAVGMSNLNRRINGEEEDRRASLRYRRSLKTRSPWQSATRRK